MRQPFSTDGLTVRDDEVEVPVDDPNDDPNDDSNDDSRERRSTLTQSNVATGTNEAHSDTVIQSGVQNMNLNSNNNQNTEDLTNYDTNSNYTSSTNITPGYSIGDVQNQNQIRIKPYIDFKKITDILHKKGLTEDHPSLLIQ